MQKPRLYTAFTSADLGHLRELGLAEHEDFFVRNDRQGKTYLREAYYSRLIGICLCQNAATQCIDPSHGFGDIDVWLFYEDAPEVNFPYRAYKKTGKPQFKETYVDFLKRNIPAGGSSHLTHFDNSAGRIVSYLLGRKTTTQKMLLQNAVIGLYPDDIFGRVIWGGKYGAVRPVSVDEMRAAVTSQME